MDYPKELRELRKLFPAIKKFQTTPSPLTKRILSLKKDLRSITNLPTKSFNWFSSLFWTYWIPKNHPLSIDPHRKSRRKHHQRTHHGKISKPQKWTKTFRPTTSNPPVLGWHPRHESRNYGTLHFSLWWCLHSSPSFCETILQVSEKTGGISPH